MFSSIQTVVFCQAHSWPSLRSPGNKTDHRVTFCILLYFPAIVTTERPRLGVVSRATSSSTRPVVWSKQGLFSICQHQPTFHGLKVSSTSLVVWQITSRTLVVLPLGRDCPLVRCSLLTQIQSMAPIHSIEILEAPVQHRIPVRGITGYDGARDSPFILPILSRCTLHPQYNPPATYSQYKVTNNDYIRPDGRMCCIPWLHRLWRCPAQR